MSAPRVLIGDDHALIRTAVASLLARQYDVIGEADNGQRLVEAARRLKPDLVVLDVSMPVLNGIDAARQIAKALPATQIVVLSMHTSPMYLRKAMEAGAKAYVLKDISAEALITCIHDVLAGKTYLAPAAAAKLAEGVTRVHLTPRELTALRLMADGKSNKEIAGELGISDRTVKTHLGHLFEKLGVTSRTEAVKVASRRGLVRLG